MEMKQWTPWPFSLAVAAAATGACVACSLNSGEVAPWWAWLIVFVWFAAWVRVMPMVWILCRDGVYDAANPGIRRREQRAEARRLAAEYGLMWIDDDGLARVPESSRPHPGIEALRRTGVSAADLCARRSLLNMPKAELMDLALTYGLTCDELDGTTKFDLINAIDHARLYGKS